MASSSYEIEIFHTPKACRFGELEEFAEVTVLSCGEMFRYVVPTFDVVTFPLRPLKIKRDSSSTEGDEWYDIFARNCPLLDRDYPAVMLVTDMLIIKEDEFSRSVETDSLKLPPEGPCIIWQWLWVGDVDHVSESSEDIRALSPSLESSSARSSRHSSNNSNQQIGLHSIIFKCIGCIHARQRQDVLEEVSELLSKNEEVPVNIHPEPENKQDSQAIAFKCYLRDSWHVIGYIVREALDDVHDAIRNNFITEVKFAWAKYVINWPRSGHGFYAGITITRKGRWSNEVCRSRSTK